MKILNSKPERLSREVIYESEWLDLYVDKVLLPAGRILDQYHTISVKKQSIASIITNSQDEILLVNVFRYPTNSIDWEIPASFVEDKKNLLLPA